MNPRRAIRSMTILLLSAVLLIGVTARAAERPNVVFILTDDQGYADLGCHGNPIIQTPNLDRLHGEAIRFTNYHVMPFCTPTRATLMTGHNATRTGAYRTSSGRTMMHTDEVTVAEEFRDNGYATGLFGKWHLGDAYPHRPQDRGFEVTRWHRCGGVGQCSDYWGNDYFDDSYEENGVFKKFEGYCTDVWFEGALAFIEANKDRPFFCYLPTNAPHGPYRVDPKYSAPYRDKVSWKNGAEFYGMIANIDENVGRLRARLRELGLEENTILIFMTDNGTAGGNEMDIDGVPAPGKGFNAGMRGRKASVYDGGHRVPWFIYWPKGGLTGGQDIPQLASSPDVMPTLLDICGLAPPKGVRFDGRSLAPLFEQDGAEWPDRTVLLQYQGGAYFSGPPEKWSHSLVMTQRWRLLDGTHLFDIAADPEQNTDVADAHAEVVQRLRAAYEAWWPAASERMRPVRIHVGNDALNPVVLSSQDWYMPVGNPPWNFGAIEKLPKVTGPWMLEVERAGRYRITLRQWPAEANRPIVADRARLRICGIEEESTVEAGTAGVTFDLDLPTGPTELETFLSNAQGETGGAYFAEVEYSGVRGKRRSGMIDVD